MFRRQTEITDLQLSAVNQHAQMARQPFAHQRRAIGVEGARQFREARHLGHHQPEQAAPGFGHQEGSDPVAREGQKLPRAGLGVHVRFGGFGRIAALALPDLREQQPLVGEIGIERGLADARLARDVIDRGAFIPVAGKNPAGAVQHLIIFAAAADFGGFGH